MGENGAQLESSEVEEDGDAVVGEVTIASGVGLDGLEQRVEPLGGGVGDAVCAVGVDVLDVPLDRVGCRLERGRAWSAWLCQAIAGRSLAPASRPGSSRTR